MSQGIQSDWPESRTRPADTVRLYVWQQKGKPRQKGWVCARQWDFMQWADVEFRACVPYFNRWQIDWVWFFDRAAYTFRTDPSARFKQAVELLPMLVGNNQIPQKVLLLIQRELKALDATFPYEK